MQKLKFDAKKAKELLKAGFGVVNTHYQDGIIRGTGALVALNMNDGNDIRILNERAYTSVDEKPIFQLIYRPFDLSM